MESAVPKSVQEVSREYQCAERTVQKWCEKNDVPFIGQGLRKQWLIYPDFEARFAAREKPGRRWVKNDGDNPK